jgi:glyoxylase-like metal-dependent hydrolase (beta-lactamase superfamily II)
MAPKGEIKRMGEVSFKIHMKIHTFPLGEMQANCYLIEHERKGILIDPADEGSFLLEKLQRDSITLEEMFLTHGHFDHCMAAGEIQLSFDIPLVIHKKDKFLIDRLEDTAKHFLGYTPVMVSPKNIQYMVNGELKANNFRLKVLESPGHTPGGVCYYFPDEAALFTGDTLFAGAIGRTDLSYSNKKDLWSSLKKILTLPDETVIYPGHGESTYVGEMKYLLD